MELLGLDQLRAELSEAGRRHRRGLLVSVHYRTKVLRVGWVVPMERPQPLARHRKRRARECQQHRRSENVTPSFPNHPASSTYAFPEPSIYENQAATVCGRCCSSSTSI